MPDSFTLHPQLKQDTFLVTDLPLCHVLLMNESRYPWLILVPRKNSIKEIHQLPEADRLQLWQESHQVSEALESLYQPDKLNIGSLGNLVPQLHIHHIARFTTDEAWPSPVWGKFEPTAYSQDEAESIIAQLQAQLA